MTYQKTRIGTLKYFHNVKSCFIGERKPYFFWKIPYFTSLLLLVQSTFIFLKMIRYLSSESAYFFFFFFSYCQLTISKKNIFKLSYRGFQFLKSELIFEKYKSQKKNNSFKILWPRVIKCPPKWRIRERKKMPHPN